MKVQIFALFLLFSVVSAGGNDVAGDDCISCLSDSHCRSTECCVHFQDDNGYHNTFCQPYGLGPYGKGADICIPRQRSNVFVYKGYQFNVWDKICPCADFKCYVEDVQTSKCGMCKLYYTVQ